MCLFFNLIVNTCFTLICFYDFDEKIEGHHIHVFVSDISFDWELQILLMVGLSERQPHSIAMVFVSN